MHIAYQVVGHEPFDLVYVPGGVSHIELAWEEPTVARFLERLASFCRLIWFDKRGTGLSDRVPNGMLPTIRVPTPVMHRTGDQDVNVAEGRHIAERIPGARFVELASDDHLPWLGEQGPFLDELQAFLTGVRPPPKAKHWVRARSRTSSPARASCSVTAAHTRSKAFPENGGCLRPPDREEGCRTGFG